jgi:glycosyltransferase involved in cell wall biosynthesis
VFIGVTDQVIYDFNLGSGYDFSFDFLYKEQIESRGKLSSFYRLCNILYRYSAKKIIYGGYLDIEFVIAMFLTPKHKNCLQFESSIKESKVSGLIALVKRIILSRFSQVLVSGTLQSEVLRALNYKGKQSFTQGVGIFNKLPDRPFKLGNKTSGFKYLFVGRLIPLKNLEFLISVFNKNGKYLTIIGAGPLESQLKRISSSNIHFTGFISNSDLHSYYLDHDIFVLPSLSEAWGLVVEEAIYHGLPVLVSDVVGCQIDLVLNPSNGRVFLLGDETSINNEMSILETNFHFFKQNVISYDFYSRDIEQISTYLDLLNK